jgi:recombination protein RecR
MYGYTRLMDHLINELTKMPGVGRKSGQRLAFYLLRADDDYVLGLADAMRRVKEGVSFCGECGNLTEGDVCAICANEDRDRTIICVVEDPQDIQALEKTGQYTGVYHVLMGAISPLDGIGPEDLEISKLVERVAAGAKEVIIATDPDVEGDATAHYLAQLLRPLGPKVSRIARGLPVGGDLRYADEVTLGKALAGRTELVESSDF